MSRYWEKRQARDAERAYRDAQTVTREIAALYQHGQIEILNMERRIRQRFRAAYQLDKETADALLSSPAGRAEYEELLEKIAKLGKKNPKRDELLAKAAAPAYAHRLSMAQTMAAELEALTARLCEQEEALVSRHLAKTAREQSLLAGFRIQQQAGVGFKFGGVSDALARQMIHEPWSGLDFSARIWMNQDALSDLLNTTLREALTLGISGEKTAERIAEAMAVPMHRARTLVRTETTYVCNQADLAAYEEAEIDEYRFHATLDMHTSPACRKLDGKTFRRKDARPGVNFPPMHPNCRSGTVQAFTQEELDRMERRARDPVTGKTVKVPASMTYEQWLNLQKETYGQERIEAKAKMAKSRGKRRDKAAIKFFKASGEDDLKNIIKRSTIKLKNGISCFPDGDVLNEHIKAVKPLKTYFDVALHGTPTAVAFGTTSPNMSARLLASVIRHSEGYAGQKIRLLSCSTGRVVDGEYCFAEELANALGVTVRAPDDVLLITANGELAVGRYGQGRFVDYHPNERRRIR